MIHLISITGPSAKHFYLEEECTSDFKSLMRTVTSGRVMIVSTKFRSDLFYSAEKAQNEAILKLWALYGKVELRQSPDNGIATFTGREASFSNYFLSINKLSLTWHFYRLYQRTFCQTFNDDQHNPITLIVAGIDQHLMKHPSIKREALLDSNIAVKPTLTEDTFSLAMYIINSETHAN
ncbi:hypothetical protein [Reichenbachiella sp.]|uniref:hypothetical protein n=1 Tax=Reichenbachiella sp. TaxID=2184521 RepID=UPI003BB05679